MNQDIKFWTRAKELVVLPSGAQRDLLGEVAGRDKDAGKIRPGLLVASVNQPSAGWSGP